jgi:hypothetical protein
LLLRLHGLDLLEIGPWRMSSPRLARRRLVLLPLAFLRTGMSKELGWRGTLAVSSSLCARLAGDGYGSRRLVGLRTF